MARQCISEHKAKQMLLGDTYTGISIAGSDDPYLKSVSQDMMYVVKVDQGVKKRFHKGLLVTQVTAKEATESIKKWEKLGYSNFILEAYMPHNDSEERYLSFERVRDGIRVLFIEKGGVHVESQETPVHTFLLHEETSFHTLVGKGIPQPFLEKVQDLLLHDYVSFIEINPLLISEKGITLLDAAILVDSAGSFFASSWNETDIVALHNTYPEEMSVATLQRSTPASLKLTVLNPNGSLFFLLSGGGGSIVALDAVHDTGNASLIANYGEYSGGPTREETYLYAKQVLSLLKNSTAKRKALVIAGGVANFTDIFQTFTGLIDALAESAHDLQAMGVKVFVRRGGPNELAGLRAMSEFLQKNDVYGSVHGSSQSITQPVTEAIDYITHSI